MKKLVLFFAAAVAVTFAACGNKASENEVKDTVVVETMTEEVIEDRRASCRERV